MSYKELIAQAIRDEAKQYPGIGGNCTEDEAACLEANVHQGWSTDGVIGTVYASPERLAEIAVATLEAHGWQVS